MTESVWDFEYSSFGIVSNVGFRASDFLREAKAILVFVYVSGCYK